MNIREIKAKRPWVRIRPGAQEGIQDFITQKDFLCEYYPTGHAINDPTVYPDIYREETIPVLDENGEQIDTKKRIYRELVPRYSFAYQQVITLKQVVHLCGNDIQFELNKTNPSDAEQHAFALFREGWLGKDMEIAFYETAKSVKITGDGAVVGFISDKKFGYKVLSFTTGDTLYPHYDSVTGALAVFARSYLDYDDEGNVLQEWVEVWDKTYLYRYKRGGSTRGTMEKIAGLFGLSGYKKVSQSPHGFPFIPVAYKRDENGACWSPAQDSIDGYELSFSQMAHNNQAYGEPILVFQGEGENADFQHNVNGTIKAVSMSVDDKISYLEAQSASESYLKQLETLEAAIYFQASIVKSPELKSGDLPAAALKMLYSPAYEKAICDAAEYQPFLVQLVKLFAYGYGVERQQVLEFTNLPLRFYIEPYVHINSSAVISDLAQAVNSGFLSKRTASEKLETIYAAPNEWERIMRQAKELGEFTEEVQEEIITEE